MAFPRPIIMLTYIFYLNVANNSLILRTHFLEPRPLKPIIMDPSGPDGRDLMGETRVYWWVYTDHDHHLLLELAREK